MTTNRLLLGALAGIAGTFAMTAAARAMHRGLPPPERYPLPPREIMEGALPAPAKRTLGEQGRRSATLAAHFGYGAATGALLLRPGHDHPLRGNWLMIVPHLVWGSTMARTLQELRLAEQEVFAGTITPDRTRSRSAETAGMSVAGLVGQSPNRSTPHRN